MDTIGYVFKAQGAAGLFGFNKFIRPVLDTLAHPTAPSDIQLHAVCLYDDCVEFAGRGADPTLEETAWQLCMRLMGSDDASVARACVWGLGLLAHRGGLFLSLLEQDVFFKRR